LITISGDYVAVGYLQGVCHVPFVFRINKQIVSAKLVKALQVLLPKKQQIKRRLFTKQKITSKVFARKYHSSSGNQQHDESCWF